MSLQDQLAAEEAAATTNGITPPDPEAAAEADAEVERIEKRKAYDRERKRKERERNGAKKRPAPSSDAAEPAHKAKRGKVEKELDPRVALAVQMCLQSMIVPEVTPEFAERMNKAMLGAIAYEIEVRLPLIADEWEPEIGLGCAMIGSGVTKFRLARYLAKKKAAEEGTVVRDVPNSSPPPVEEPASGGDGS